MKIPESHYQQQNVGGDSVRFTVTPASVPKATGAPLVIGVLAAFSVFAVEPLGRHGFGAFLNFPLAIAAGIFSFRGINIWFTRNVDKQRSPGGTFTVSPTMIETASGEKVSGAELHRLILRNGIPDIGVVAVQNGSAAAGAANDRAANRAKAALVSWMLCAEAGGRSTILAGGMTEVTAYGLLSDVAKIMGRTVS